ncbi:LysM peptidoglycan-binding domain-containing protein [Apilactobacillus bombintestini]|uniref:LysM peptidoglycan-binding domain-containing protein n=1 Tax=Apilactobacillus bombintestini TaxID=2419772 RepID=A0A387AQG1_9LACO|nr:LysM peptidoglycan-binding domain-containing protein [Apilactobacillus bombintestini]AYF93012.1 LysM peptidoglycan-binding domain-containing protein [Apilactobacillus bombintestini]
MLFATAAVAGLFVAGGSANANAHADQTNSQVQQVTTTKVNNTKYVVVKSGDTLWGLSQKHHVSLHALRSANKRENTDLIYAGEKLVIPNSSVKKVVTKRAAQPAAQTTQSAQLAAQPAQNTQNVQAAPTQNTQPTQTTQRTQSVAQPAANSSAAKEWIAQRESSGSYTASNGNYYGRYQLSSSMLHGDYSAANQERVANQYVSSRYGSWDNAKSFWMQNGWY